MCRMFDNGMDSFMRNNYVSFKFAVVLSCVLFTMVVCVQHYFTPVGYYEQRIYFYHDESEDYFWNPSYKMPDPFLSLKSCKICRPDTIYERAPGFFSKTWIERRNIRRELESYVPKFPPNVSAVFGNNVSCAIVTGSPELRRYKYGALIDQFQVVLRFNLHGTIPTESYGSKTTHMIINQRLNGNLELIKDRPEIIISRYQFTPERVLKYYLSRRNHGNRSLVFNKQFIGISRDTLSKGVHRKINGIATTGFLGMMLLSRSCSSVHAFGFVDPVNEYTDPIHDYDSEHELLQIWNSDENAQVKLYLYPPLS